MFQPLGELMKLATEIESTSVGLNPQMQNLVDEALQQGLPAVFNLDALKSNAEQEEIEKKEFSKQLEQELKEDFPELNLPEELGERLNTELQCGNELFFQIPSQITHELRSRISNLLGNSEFVPGRLHNLIDNALRPYTENLIPGLVYNSISGSLADNYNWCDFSISVLGCECDQARWQVSMDILQTCGDVYPFENTCYVCDRPTKISLDENQRVHAWGEPAIEYPDGFQIHAYHGTLFPDKYTAVPPSQWQPQWYQEEPENRLRQALIEALPPEQLQVNWLLEEENTILRRLLVDKIGYDRVLHELNINDDLHLLSQATQDHSESSFWVAYSILQNRIEPKIQQVIERWQTLGSGFSELRKMLLIDSLERILNWLKSNVPEYEDDFLPGLTHGEIEEKVKDLPFKLPQEVYDLYQWRNGSASESGIFLYLHHSPLERALENSEFTNYPEGIDIRIEDNDPPYLFPVFEFEGEYFAVQGDVAEAETSLVFHIGSEGGTSLVFNSLTTMMLSIAESYESGVYICQPENNYMNWEDMKKSGEIRLKYNPGTVKQIYSEGG